MHKQEIAHSIEDQITELNTAIGRLKFVLNQTIDSHQARDLLEAIDALNAHKKALRKIVTNIVEDAKFQQPLSK